MTTSPQPQESSLIEVLLNEILRKLGLTDISDDQKKEYITKLTPIVENRIFRAVLMSLTDEERKQFEAIDANDEFDPAMLEMFLTKPEKQQVIEEELAKLVDDLGSMPGA